MADDPRASMRLKSLALQIVACESKVHFAKRGDAMKFADRHGLKQGEYRCQVCGDWHLTTNLRPQR